MCYVMDENGKVRRVSPPPVCRPPEGSEEMRRKVRELEESAKTNPPRVTSLRELVEEVGSFEALLAFKK